MTPPAPYNPQALRVFVVEDHDDTLTSICRCLKRLGHAVFSAQCMKEALEALPKADCDVLLSDIGLPDGDGWELLRRVTPVLPRPIHAIAMSGFGTTTDCLKSRAAGFEHHLIKPFSPLELKALLDQVASHQPLHHHNGVPLKAC